MAGGRRDNGQMSADRIGPEAPVPSSSSPPGATRWVRVVVVGTLGPGLTAGLAPLTARSSAGNTVLEGVVADIDALLDCLGDLGMTLVSLDSRPSGP